MALEKIRIALILVLVALFMSCGGDDEPNDITGCTDDRAENFDPNATSDNGECIFPNDKFFGIYEGSFNCGSIFSTINQESVTFEITPPADPNEVNKVTLSANIAGIPLSLEGDVDNNDIVFIDKVLTDITIPNPATGDDITVDITFSGTATIDGNSLTAELVVSTVLVIPISDSCTFSGTKQ